MTRPILYISGPYSPGNGRTIAENIAVARAHAVAAAKAGWMPFTPHLNTAHFEVDARALLDWQRFRTYNPHWVITDES